MLHCWDLPLSEVVLPPSLRALYLRELSEPLQHNVLRSLLLYLFFHEFCHVIVADALPPNLIDLSVSGYAYPHPLPGAFPAPCATSPSAPSASPCSRARCRRACSSSTCTTQSAPHLLYRPARCPPRCSASTWTTTIDILFQLAWCHTACSGCGWGHATGTGASRRCCQSTRNSGEFTSSTGTPRPDSSVMYIQLLAGPTFRAAICAV